MLVFIIHLFAALCIAAFFNIMINGKKFTNKYVYYIFYISALMLVILTNLR